jgi:predicted RNase H-like HicB family nuclease
MRLCCSLQRIPNAIAEVRRELRKAIRFHLDGMREDGLMVPRPLTKVDFIEA